MLNEDKNNDGTACSGEESMIYSLVSEANDKTDNDAGSQSKPSDCVEEHKIGVQLGLLILDGEEEVVEDGSDDGGESKPVSNKASASLSVPDTVYLPSDIRSMTDGGTSGVTHEQDKNKDKDDNGNNNWCQLLSRRRAGPCFGFSFNIMILILLSMILVSLTALASSHAWKNEALRLREEQHTLLKERESLLEKQKLLEEIIKNASKGSDYDALFLQDESEDDTILSIKNCYIEASLSLGQCSKEWQRWWYHQANEGSSTHEHGDDKEDANEYHSFYDDGFTDDMEKLVSKVKSSLASTKVKSYSFIEKALRELSYEGIKDAWLSGDGYVQSIVQCDPKTSSNNDTGFKGRIFEA